MRSPRAKLLSQKLLKYLEMIGTAKTLKMCWVRRTQSMLRSSMALSKAATGNSNKARSLLTVQGFNYESFTGSKLKIQEWPEALKVDFANTNKE